MSARGGIQDSSEATPETIGAFASLGALLDNGALTRGRP